MALTLLNFKSAIDPTILQRGRQYYQQGRVIDLEEVGDGIWAAQVKGTEVYDVSIEQDDRGALDGDCTCPYDMGPICKHIAAVLYAIEEAFPAYLAGEATAKPKKPPRAKKPTRAEKIEAVLSSLSREELAALVREWALNNRELAYRLMVQYGDTGDDKTTHIRMVKDALRLGQGRDGFIDYYGARRAAEGVESLLARADDLLKQGCVTQAVAIWQAVIETVTPAIGYADDSDGLLGDCINDALRHLAEAVPLLSAKERRALFAYCLNEAQAEKYEGWDWGWDLARMAADMISSAAERAEVFTMLDRLATRRGASQDETRQWLAQYDQERAALIKLSIVEKDGDEAATLAFIRQHAHLHRFQERLINYYLERGNLAEVKRLCYAWLDDLAAAAPRDKLYYFATLLDVAQREGDAAEVIRLARLLFLNGQGFRYYDLLKQHIPKHEWPAQVQALIREQKNAPQVLAEIYAREAMWDDLMELAQKAGIYVLERYRQHLEPRFPDRMGDIYERIVFDKLERASHRGTYAEAAEYLRRMQQMGQGQRVEEIIERLVTTYRNRRAMIEELHRLRG